MTDHTPTSLEQLRAILTALANSLPEATPLGRVLVDGQNGSAYAAICAEIAQTVRPRHLLFTCQNQQQLAVIVRAGTVLRLTDPTSATLSDLAPDLPNRDLHPDAKGTVKGDIELGHCLLSMSWTVKFSSYNVASESNFVVLRHSPRVTESNTMPCKMFVHIAAWCIAMVVCVKMRKNCI